MADYRRLISYIYEYEGKQKGKNVGFAKLEARNGQCRINVNVKRIYMGGNAIGAYLLGTGGRETFLGNVFVRGGNGEFRANVDTKNVEGTGTGLDTYFGLSVHDVKNSWRCYKTIWEDALAAEEGNTGENPVLSVPKFTAESRFGSVPLFNMKYCGPSEVKSRQSRFSSSYPSSPKITCAP